MDTKLLEAIDYLADLLANLDRYGERGELESRLRELYNILNR